MTDPHDPQINPSRFRPSTVPPSSTYTFSHVFPPDTSQSDFFAKTTLPLVRDALQGQSGLLFAYGVTNSGKTYTVQGGVNEKSAGILPRSLDVIFNSIEGLHGDGTVNSQLYH
jgi:kinesin family protein 20